MIESDTDRGSIRGRGYLSLTRLVPLALLLALAGAPVCFGATRDCVPAAAGSNQSIPVDDLGDWEPVNDRELLVWTRGATRAHLIRLARSIPGLSDADVVSLNDGDHDGQISPCGEDSVETDDGGTARIVSIEYLSAARTAQMDLHGQATL